MTRRRWKAKSPEVFKPSNPFGTVREAINTFTTQRGATIAYIQATNNNLRNYYWKHPLTGKIDLHQTLLLLSAHLERHTEQIAAIKLSNGFPK